MVSISSYGPPLEAAWICSLLMFAAHLSCQLPTSFGRPSASDASLSGIASALDKPMSRRLHAWPSAVKDSDTAPGTSNLYENKHWETMTLDPSVTPPSILPEDAFEIKPDFEATPPDPLFKVGLHACCLYAHVHAHYSARSSGVLGFCWTHMPH